MVATQRTRIVVMVAKQRTRLVVMVAAQHTRPRTRLDQPPRAA